jgi:hypothetical protein
MAEWCFLRVYYAKYNALNKRSCLSVLLCHNRNSGQNLKDFGVGHHVTSFIQMVSFLLVEFIFWKNSRQCGDRPHYGKDFVRRLFCLYILPVSVHCNELTTWTELQMYKYLLCGPQKCLWNKLQNFRNRKRLYLVARSYYGEIWVIVLDMNYDYFICCFASVCQVTPLNITKKSHLCENTIMYSDNCLSCINVTE